MSTRPDEGEERPGPVVRDNRRIDPETGAVREPAATGNGKHGKHAKPADAEPSQEPGQQPSAEPTQASTTEPSEELSKATAQLAERTADLQRLQAEYANYRKRVERDRVLVREQALANVLNELLPILDDIGRAREHNELTGGFKSVGEALEATVGKLGLERFGEKGEPFDPMVHEALMHSFSSEVTETTCIDVLQPGYRIGTRILRPARVAVAEPAEPEAQTDSQSDSETETAPDAE